MKEKDVTITKMEVVKEEATSKFNIVTTSAILIPWNLEVEFTQERCHWLSALPLILVIHLSLIYPHFFPPFANGK